MNSYECAFCGQLNATTDDHIPPDCFYSDPKPSNLPTVKSCKKCNESASKDDEYFLHTVLKYRKIPQLPQARQQVDAMYRAARNPNKKRYTRKTLESFQKIELRSPSGLFLGRALTFKVKSARVERTIRRYIKGLYKYETGKRLPDNLKINVISNPDTIHRMRSQLEKQIPLVSKTVQEGVFWYAWAQAIDDPNCSFWVLVFFDNFPIIAYIEPE